MLHAPIVARTGGLSQGLRTPGWRQPWLAPERRATLSTPAGRRRLVGPLTRDTGSGTDTGAPTPCAMN
ncbi:hypothetical protein AB4Z54_16630, partial [Streptomyces sp. MCAF7]